ncbi:hypothetical protein ABT083_17155 [Streptomyces goshikiensis]|uniref:hypothetical protein n=1 Tax=Streptomyces goshikiensis TaxID=1942 RepID=UPI00332A8DFD
MLAETLVALAAAGGTAVVQAAGKDMWAEFRQQIARWFGRGDAEREQAELERLEQTANVLATAGDDDEDPVRIRQEASWQARIESMLESLGEGEQKRAAAALRALLAESFPNSTQVAAGEGSVAAGGDITATADRGSIASMVIHGDIQMGTQQSAPQRRDDSQGPAHPQMPDPSQG